MNRRLIIAALAVAMVSGSAAQFQTNPTADAFVTTGPTQNLRDSNYGATGALGISAPGSANGEFQTLLRFDLSGAKTLFDAQFGAGLWTIESMSLQLTASPANNPLFNPNAPGTFNIHCLQNDGWIEGPGTTGVPASSGITFNSLQSAFLTPGSDQHLGSFSYGGASTGSSVYALSLSTGLAQDALSGDITSLWLSADDGTSYLFNSRTFSIAGSRPLLTVVAVPEPGVWGMGLVGTVVMLWSRWRARL
jgi:hypothetical protein